MINFAAMERYTYAGETLDVGQIIALSRASVVLAREVRERIASNRQKLDQLLLESDHPFYGINTGFGTLYSVSVSREDVKQLQVNLLRSHACGTGPAAPSYIVRLTILLKVISLSKGHSGVRLEVVERLLDFLDKGILPVVPSQGSLGASGDLAPLAHLCLPLMGEGEVIYKREQMPAERALALAGLEPLELESKEGLALINGTQYSLAWLIYALDNSSRIADLAEMCAALSIEGYDGHPSALDPLIHELRNQEGQQESAAAIRKWLEGSDIHQQPKKHIQDPYSFRCAPQVHGASRDVIKHAWQIASREINAVTDNPLVLDDDKLVRIVSGGNFHAQPLALASDMLTIALSEYGSISERRSYLLLSGQRGLPLALALNPGLESGMMICQYTGASLVNRNKILSHPASTDTIVTSAGQEDHVSMAANAGMKLYEVVHNVWRLLAIEWMIAAQALVTRRPLKSSQALEDVITAYRLKVPALTGDRVFSGDMDTTENFLRSLTVG